MRKLLWVLMAAALVAGCRGGHDDHNRTLGSALVVAASDYAGANVIYGLSLDDDGLPAGKLRARPLGDDPKLDPRLPALANLGGGELVLIRREWGSAVKHGTLAWLDPARRFAVGKTMSVAGAAGQSNPQDYLRVAPNKAYVTRFDPAYDDVLIIDPITREKRGHIDLTGIADNPDGLARPTRMLLFDNRVLLLLQDIDAAFGTYGSGKLAIINPFTDQVVRVIDLGRKNPQMLVPAPERNTVLIACAGDWSDPSTSGVLEVDSDGTVALAAAGEDPDLNGYLGDLVYFSGGPLLVLNTKADWSGNYIQPVDLDSGAVGASIYFSFYITDLARDRFGHALVADNITSQAIALNPDTGATVYTVDLAVPPQSLLDWHEED